MRSVRYAKTGVFRCKSPTFLPTFPASYCPFLIAFFHFIMESVFKDGRWAEESLCRIPFMFLHVAAQAMDIGMQSCEKCGCESST